MVKMPLVPKRSRDRGGVESLESRLGGSPSHIGEGHFGCPPREILALGSAAAVVSCRHIRAQPVHRYRRAATSNVVGRHPNGSCARRRVTTSCTVPSQPHRRHHRSSSTTRQASTARSGSRRCPVTSNPRPSRRRNVVRSGVVQVPSGISRSSRWGV